MCFFSDMLMMHGIWVILITMRQSVIFYMFIYHTQGIKITKALESVNFLRHSDICCYNLYYYYYYIFSSLLYFYCTINSVVAPIFGWIFYVLVIDDTKNNGKHQHICRAIFYGGFRLENHK